MKIPHAPWRLALFLATSGHSGVDRIMKNFIAELGTRPIAVDLLQVQGHGPFLEKVPENVRLVPLGTRHVQSSLLRVAHYLRTERPDALLCDKDRVNRTALLAASMAGYKGRLVVRIGTTVSKNLEGRGFGHRLLQYWSLRHLYGKAHAVVVPSQGAAEDLCSIASLPPGLVRVLPSPVVTEGLETLGREPVPHPWFASEAYSVILGAGELCERKDFATLIRAFAALPMQNSYRLVILGKGKKRKTLEKLAKDLGVADRIHFPGFVKNPYAYMAKSRIFVLSSTCEGLPVVLMEAMALGIPVASTDCPSGPREILDQGRLGPLVPVKSWEKLAEAITYLLDHTPDREALKAAVSRYRVPAATNAYLQVLGNEDVALPES